MNLFAYEWKIVYYQNSDEKMCTWTLFENEARNTMTYIFGTAIRLC